jgi:hypothetical protein
MELDCQCGAGGKWKVVERDGQPIEADYLGDDTSHGDTPTVLLSKALTLAKLADGPVRISDLSATSIRLDVDQELNAIDDEFVLYASNIIIDK